VIGFVGADAAADRAEDRKVAGDLQYLRAPPKVEGICDNDGGELFQRPTIAKT